MEFEADADVRALQDRIAEHEHQTRVLRDELQRLLFEKMRAAGLLDADRRARDRRAWGRRFSD